MIGVIDYGAGNLLSVSNALDRLGVPNGRCATVRDLDRAERIVLPGVGHFGAAGRHLRRSELDVAIRKRAQAGTPLLGICLGMQLLVDTSDEADGVSGLSLLPGRTIALEARRVPHMGWNRVCPRQATPLLRESGYFYFAHSYVVDLQEPGHSLGTTNMEGAEFPAMIGRDNIWGVQFHPEKSGDLGLELLKAFSRC